MSVKYLPDSDQVEVSIRMPKANYDDLVAARRKESPFTCEPWAAIEVKLSILIQRYINDQLYGDD